MGMQKVGRFLGYLDGEKWKGFRGFLWEELFWLVSLWSSLGALISEKLRHDSQSPLTVGFKSYWSALI